MSLSINEISYLYHWYQTQDCNLSLCFCVLCFRAVRVLLKFGADPNLPDEFSNIYFVAREKGLNSLQGMGHFYTIHRHWRWLPNMNNVCG